MPSRSVIARWNSGIILPVTITLACALAIINLTILAAYYFRKPQIEADGHTYSYVGNDYPELYSMSDIRQVQVAMLVQESRSYPISGVDAQERWATSSPDGFGYVRLGPENRAFAVSMFHQLHCTRLMRAALSGRYDPYSRGHMQHCLNYIRQMILCTPNLTLEPANVLSRNFETDRTGATHVCSNWSALYSEMTENWNNWLKSKDSADYSITEHLVT